MPPTSHVVLKDGSKITIEGSTEEVARIALLVTGNQAPVKTTSHAETQKPARLSKKTKGVTDQIRDLKTDGFFKTGKTLEQVRDALKTAGYIYAPHELSPVLLRLRRGSEIGRIMEKGKWLYTHR